MKWKNQGLIDSILPKFGDGVDTTGPANKITPMSSNSRGSNTPSFFQSIGNLFKPTTKYRRVEAGSGTIGGATDTPIDKFKGFFTSNSDKTGAVESGGAGGGSTLSTTTQYAGIAGIGLAAGDLAGSWYNKRKSKRGKK